MIGKTVKKDLEVLKGKKCGLNSELVMTEFHYDI